MEKGGLLQEESFSKAVIDVWKKMTSLEVDPTPYFRQWRNAQDILTACVVFRGSWRGGIILRVPMGLARKAASAMFFTAENELKKPETFDAILEIVNVVAGIVKAELPADCVLSKATSIEGKTYSKLLQATSRVLSANFISEGELFRLDLLKG